MKILSSDWLIWKHGKKKSEIACCKITPFESTVCLQVTYLVMYCISEFTASKCKYELGACLVQVDFNRILYKIYILYYSVKSLQTASHNLSYEGHMKLQYIC